jgi:hypothetical protein
MGKKKSRSGSGMNIPDQISESLETIFWIKDPESFSPWIRDGKIQIRDKHPGSVTLRLEELSSYRRRLQTPNEKTALRNIIYLKRWIFS